MCIYSFFIIELRVDVAVIFMMIIYFDSKAEVKVIFYLDYHIVVEFRGKLMEQFYEI